MKMQRNKSLLRFHKTPIENNQFIPQFFFLITTAVMGIAISPVLTGCGNSRLDTKEVQKIRSVPVQFSRTQQTRMLSGSVERTSGWDHRISLPKKPCSDLTNVSFLIIPPTIDKERVRASVSSQNNNFVLTFRYPPHFLDRTRVTIEMNGCRDPGWQIPIESVWNPTGSSPGVFVVRNDRAIRIQIFDLENFRNGTISVKGDLKENDRVIVEGLEGLIHNEKVEEVP